MKRSELIAVAGSLLALGACAHARLSPQGARVSASSGTAAEEGFEPSSCTSLGFVVGRGGGAFGGGWMANDALVEAAMNDLRNKAASLGANYIKYDSPQLGVAGGSGSTTTSTATVSGMAYRCARVAEGSKPPSGGGGFRFGASPDQIATICKEAGANYDGKETGGTCSNTAVDLGSPGHVDLTYCSGRVCQIDVVLAPSATDLLDRFRSLRDRLRDKYGTPSSMKKDVDRCHDEAAECVVAGDAWFALEWSWPSHHSVSLRTKAIAGKACIEMTYSSPERAAEKPGPAL
jgi:hypothetical protein